MDIHLIALSAPHETAWKKLRQRWPDHHHVLNDDFAFVAPPGVCTLTKIQDVVGMSTDPDVAIGIVVPLVDHAGVLANRTVQWPNAANHA